MSLLSVTASLLCPLACCLCVVPTRLSLSLPRRPQPFQRSVRLDRLPIASSSFSPFSSPSSSRSPSLSSLRGGESVIGPPLLLSEYMDGAATTSASQTQTHTDSTPLRTPAPQPSSSIPILSSFLGRARRHSNSHLLLPASPTAPDLPSPASPQQAQPHPPSPSQGHRRRPANVQPSHSVPVPTPTAPAQAPSTLHSLSGMLALRRRRSAGAINNANSGTNASNSAANPSSGAGARNENNSGSTRDREQIQQQHQAFQQQLLGFMPGPASASRQRSRDRDRERADRASPAGSGHRNAGATAPSPAQQPQAQPQGTGPAHRIRLVPHLDSRRSLKFDAIARDVREGDAPLRIGRFTDRSGMGISAANALSSNKLAFKSKVVSRAHAEIWCEGQGRFLIKDTKSSSGTFLNHVRLSPANSESRAHELKDGDILQLGVDYQGGTEDIYKCVKIRVEVGREWQSQANAFNTNALQQLRSLAANPKDPAAPVAAAGGAKKHAKTSLPDCCICLFSVTIQQSLFIAPCSHAFHYKCIRPLLDTHYPAFSCPLCRTYADLDADVELDAAASVEGADFELAEATGLGFGVSADAEPVTPGGLSRAVTRAGGEEGAYPETDIEVDTGASRLAVSRRTLAPQSAISPDPGLGHVGEDDEMVAAAQLAAAEDERERERERAELGVLSEDEEDGPEEYVNVNAVLAGDIDGDDFERGLSVSPVPGPASGAPGMLGQSPYGSDEEASGSGGSVDGQGRRRTGTKRQRYVINV